MKSEEHAFRVETVAEGLETPWSIAFLPDGRMLVTEKAGRLRIVEKGKLLPEPWPGVPPVWSEGQGGLLDVAAAPRLRDERLDLPLLLATPGADGTAMTGHPRPAQATEALVDQETLYEPPAALPDRAQPLRLALRLRRKGHLFFTIGERGQKDDAQDLSRPNGKMHRILDDGRVPDGQPVRRSTPGALPTIWSYGHRNPQGLARHPVTGELYDAEHGPRGGDELNLVLPGRNYGWPVITYGMNYDGTPITDLTAKEGMEQPVAYWTPSIAVCAIDFYAGDRFPRWKNDLLVSSLAAEELRRLRDRRRQGHEAGGALQGLGRIRDVVSGPDGLVYVAFNGPDRIARLVPATP